MTLVLCGHGTLSVILIGRPGSGNYPEVTVSQGDRTLAYVRTSAFKTMDNRNLLVSRLTFSPDGNR